MKEHDGKFIYINTSVQSTGDNCKDLSTTYACYDRVWLRIVPIGKEKITAFNVLFKFDLNLQQLCSFDADEKDILIMCQLYGGMRSTDRNELRYQIFSKKK